MLRNVRVQTNRTLSSQRSSVQLPNRYRKDAETRSDILSVGRRYCTKTIGNWGSTTNFQLKQTSGVPTLRTFAKAKEKDKSSDSDGAIKFDKKFWGDQNNWKKGIDFLTDKLNIRSLDDWYRVSGTQIVALSNFKGVTQYLPFVYPTHRWDMSKFKSAKKSSQRKLALAVAELFPGSRNFV